MSSTDVCESQHIRNWNKRIFVDDLPLFEFK